MKTTFDAGRLAGFAIAVSISFGGAACATTAPAVQDPAVAEANATKSDGSAQAVVAELLAKDYAAVTARFDATMRALSAEKLAEVWDPVMTELGAPGASSIVHRTHVDGYDVRVVMQDFEKGRVQITVSFHPGSQEVAGLFFKPVPAAVTEAP